MNPLRVCVSVAGVVAVAVSTAGIAGSPGARPPSPIGETRRLMGTLCEVRIFHADAGLAARAASAALDEMQRVDRLLSNYDPASELSAMNRDAGRAPFRASEELFAFVRRCRDHVAGTGGAFDPTVGPLVRAWGFFTPRPAKPSDEAIAAARARVGFDKVRLNDADRTVSFAVPDLEIDPGGIGKGYAVDRAVGVLRRSGIAVAMVSAGGSTIYAMGAPPDREAWRLAIGDPSNAERPIRYVRLRDAAVSTSGVSQKFVVVNGRRYSHIFDPRTAEPLGGMCQASVVASNATDSDALTKGALILERDAAVRLIARERGAHMLRVEGACGPDQVIWTTPWSSGVFVEDPGGRP